MSVFHVGMEVRLIERCLKLLAYPEINKHNTPVFTFIFQSSRIVFFLSVAKHF